MQRCRPLGIVRSSSHRRFDRRQRLSCEEVSRGPVFDILERGRAIVSPPETTTRNITTADNTEQHHPAPPRFNPLFPPPVSRLSQDSSEAVRSLTKLIKCPCHMPQDDSTGGSGRTAPNCTVIKHLHHCSWIVTPVPELFISACACVSSCLPSGLSSPQLIYPRTASDCLRPSHSSFTLTPTTPLLILTHPLTSTHPQIEYQTPSLARLRTMTAPGGC